MIKMFFFGFLLLGMVLIVVSLFVGITMNKKRDKCTHLVYARIIDLKQAEGDEVNRDPFFISYFPVYEYEYMEKVYRKTSNLGNKKSSFEIGKPVKIYIDPANPQKICENSSVPKILVGIMTMTGVVMIGVAIGLKIIFF